MYCTIVRLLFSNTVNCVQVLLRSQTVNVLYYQLDCFKVIFITATDFVRLLLLNISKRFRVERVLRRALHKFTIHGLRAFSRATWSACQNNIGCGVFATTKAVIAEGKSIVGLQGKRAIPSPIAYCMAKEETVG